VTQDAQTRLHLVTGNHVGRLVDDGPRADERSGADVDPAGDPELRAGARPLADLRHRAAALDALVAAEAAPRALRCAGLVGVGAALTLVLAMLGRQAWQLPQRGPGGVTDVPQSLLTFLLLCAALCLWSAGRLVRPAGTVRSATARALWWALVAGAALVSFAADLSLASFAGTGQRPDDLLLRCAVPLVPAVLAGVLAGDAGRAARVRAALGTGLVTVPMSAVGWALLSSPGRSTAGLGDVLGMTALAGAAPLVLAVAFVAADRRPRRSR
jgi:hypothetical protein